MKKSTLYFIAICLQMWLFSNAYAQSGEIQGKVSDAETGETLPFVNVAININGSLVGATSDFDGVYTLHSIRPGIYTVTFSYVGYTTLKVEKIKVQANKTTFLDVELSGSSETLQAIEILSYKVPLLKSDKTSSGKTATAKQIKSMPTRNTNSIAGNAAGVHSPKKAKKGKQKGARNGVTNYHIDGVKVRESKPVAATNPKKSKSKKNKPSKKQITLPKPTPKTLSPQLEEGSYADVPIENQLLSVREAPLSTFSIDVDKAAYSYLRSTLNTDALPNPNDVRIEEMINYFEYEYPQAGEKVPFSVTTELTDCPWNPKHQLALIGLQGRDMEIEHIPPQNLVFLMDVSGSMSSQNKLPLLKEAFSLLVKQLRPQDKVAIVVYAGAAGVVLPPTNGDQKSVILDALNRLNAGGSTAGGAGIKLAYNLAHQNFESGGNNRVILATDGDFNVGTSSNEGLVKLIEEKRKTGVFLSVLGFGTGNYQDEKMEQLSNHGNGNYAYIDNIKEAKKVLINELSSTLFTIAKDVKLQVAFNPDEVQAYRLVGYVNRRLQDEDFDNDAKDAGEMGAGHSVTALYELVPMGVAFEAQSSDKASSKATRQKRKKAKAALNQGGILTVHLRHKAPTSDTSTKTEYSLNKHAHTNFNKASENLQWASAVTTFGMLLQNDDFQKNMNFNDVLKMAKNALGKDEKGYRQEMIALIQKAQQLKKDIATASK